MYTTPPKISTEHVNKSMSKFYLDEQNTLIEHKVGNYKFEKSEPWF